MPKKPSNKPLSGGLTNRRKKNPGRYKPGPKKGGRRLTTGLRNVGLSGARESSAVGNRRHLGSKKAVNNKVRK